MVLLMFRGDRIEEIPACVDVVHKEGRVVCFDREGKPLATFPDAALLYYTLNSDCIQTIHKTKLSEPNETSAGSLPLKQPPASVLERLWRMRKAREVKRRRELSFP